MKDFQFASNTLHFSWQIEHFSRFLDHHEVSDIPFFNAFQRAFCKAPICSLGRSMKDLFIMYSSSSSSSIIGAYVFSTFRNHLVLPAPNFVRRSSLTANDQALIAPPKQKQIQPECHCQSRVCPHCAFWTERHFERVQFLKLQFSRKPL